MGLGKKHVYSLIIIALACSLSNGVLRAGKTESKTNTSTSVCKAAGKTVKKICRKTDVQGDKNELVYRQKLEWADAENGEVLFGISDIVRFDWDKQIFELTRRKAMDLLGKQTGLHRKFVLMDGEEIIYEGNLVSISSSISCPGPAIILENLDGIKPPLFKIYNGYPEQIAKFDPDLRFSGRLKKALQQADVLGEIDLNEPPVPIERVTHGWFGEKDSLRILVEVFPETFQLRQLSRIHLHLIGADYLNKTDYIVQVNTTLTANDGKFRYSTQRIFPSKGEGWKNIYVLGMNPWNSVKDSIDRIAKPGSAQITLDICTRKIIDENKDLYSEPIENVKTGPINVTILPQERNELLEEAKTVMAKFQQALKASEWNKALSHCSDVIQSEAKEYESAEIFFKDVVPIEQIISVSNIQTFGGQFGPDNKRLAYFCFLRLSEPDAKPTINWEWRLNKTNSDWAVDFKNIPLDSWIEQEKLRLNSEHEKAKERDRTLQEGLKLSLVPLSDGFVIGQPMLFHLEMTNISGSPIAYEKTSFSMINNPIAVIGPVGEKIPNLDFSCQTMVWEEIIEPNETVILADNYDVTTQYHIVQPGQYTFQFTGHWVLKSNIAEMDIKTGEFLPREIIVEKLLSVLSEGWTLARSSIQGKDDSQSEADSKLFITLTGKWGMKGLGAGHVGLSILINPGDSGLQSHRFEGQFWGQSPWGPVYVQSKDAELLWPNYRKKIMKALDIQKIRQN